MKGNFKIAAENILFALLVFIVFLLAFDRNLVVPEWVQVAGRMHPMILHFPIVIVLMAMFVEFVSYKPTKYANEYLRNFSSALLFSGALLSALTVITGLILSKEEGYSGNILQWHKWSGVGIAFFSSLIYWIRRYSWYKTPVAQINAVLTAALIIFTGHYGAGLTHGDDFVMEPLNRNRMASVPIEKAIVFEHVIQPILNSKCVSCHNPDKLKGQLMLTDSVSILKGGKTGTLIEAGNPQMSLLVQRIHLPADDKKHMPPIGKSQLTDEEIRLLYLWLKSDALFTKKLIDLPENDSLRVLASKQFKTEGQEQELDFDPADEGLIAKLNTDYRVILPHAKNSPALEVNFYNRKIYRAKDLEELQEIKSQIISLNMSKMPVKDHELKQIGEFNNLRHLNLNYTDITGSGLKDLIGLKNLKTLSLTGTKLTVSTLSEITRFKNLKKVYLWDTGIKEDQLAELRKADRTTRFITGFEDDGTNPIRLNMPELKAKTQIFSTPLEARLEHSVRGTIIRYTLDGSEPDSVKSPIYSKTIPIKENTIIKTRAYKQGWYGSDIAEFKFFKGTYRPDSIILKSNPNYIYKAEGGKTLVDGQIGTIYYRGNGDKWLGFRGNDLDVLLEFKIPVTLSSVALNSIFSPASNVFPPSAVEIWGGSDRNMKLLGTISPLGLKKGDKAFIAYMSASFAPKKITFLRVVAKSVKKMPDWQNAKGRPALLLIDELLLN